jgi:hypothetical protein
MEVKMSMGGIKQSWEQMQYYQYQWQSVELRLLHKISHFIHI